MSIENLDAAINKKNWFLPTHAINKALERVAADFQQLQDTGIAANDPNLQALKKRVTALTEQALPPSLGEKISVAIFSLGFKAPAPKALIKDTVKLNANVQALLDSIPKEERKATTNKNHTGGPNSGSVNEDKQSVLKKGTSSAARSILFTTKKQAMDEVKILDANLTKVNEATKKQAMDEDQATADKRSEQGAKARAAAVKLILEHRSNKEKNSTSTQASAATSTPKTPSAPPKQTPNQPYNTTKAPPQTSQKKNINPPTTMINELKKSLTDSFTEEAIENICKNTLLLTKEGMSKDTIGAIFLASADLYTLKKNIAEIAAPLIKEGMTTEGIKSILKHVNTANDKFSLTSICKNISSNITKDTTIETIKTMIEEKQSERFSNLLLLTDNALKKPEETKYSLDFYKIDGVAPKTLKELKEVHTSIRLLSHPDKINDPEQKQNAAKIFQYNNEAFDKLKNKMLK